MQVAEAPVSKSAVYVVTWGGVAGAGVKMPGAATPTLIIGPRLGLNFPLRHGIGEEAQVNRHVDNFLHGEEAIFE